MTVLRNLLTKVRINENSTSHVATAESLNPQTKLLPFEQLVTTSSSFKMAPLPQGVGAAETYPRSAGRQLLQYNRYNSCDYYGNCNYWSGGRIAGVIVGCVCFALAILFAILACTIRRRRMARYQVNLCPILCSIFDRAAAVPSLTVVTMNNCFSGADQQCVPSWYIPCSTAGTIPDQPVSSEQHLSQSGISTKHRRLQPSTIQCCGGAPQHSYRHPC